MSFKIIMEAFELPLVGNDKLVFLALYENTDFDVNKFDVENYKKIAKEIQAIKLSDRVTVWSKSELDAFVQNKMQSA